MSMETDSPVVYHGTSESRFPKNEIQKMVTELTLEERETFRQCNKESLYYRCLPFAAIGMAATHLAARKGFIKPHRILGTTIPMTGAAFAGWLIGKFSYRRQCEDKFVRLENSNIGQAIRKKRGYVSDRFQSDFSKSSTFEEDMNLRDDPSFSYYPDSDFHSSTSSLNLDMDKNVQYSGLDDRERPSTDRDVMQSSQESGQARTFTTYEDLRYRNREKYARSQPQSSQLGDTKNRSNVDSELPRRSSDFSDGDNRRTGSNTNTWDTKLF